MKTLGDEHEVNHKGEPGSKQRQLGEADCQARGGHPAAAGILPVSSSSSAKCVQSFTLASSHVCSRSNHTTCGQLAALTSGSATPAHPAAVPTAPPTSLRTSVTDVLCA